MHRSKTVKTVLSAILIAVAIGFVVQDGTPARSADERQDTEVHQQAPRSLVLTTNALGQAVFGLSTTRYAPTNHRANLQSLAFTDTAYPDSPSPVFAPLMSVPSADCPTTISARRRPAAMVTLDIAAACEQEAEFVVLHSGLRVSGVTDSDGNATVTMPALVADARFDVTFDHLWKAASEVFVPETRRFDRAVLQWTTSDNIRLHAMEDGASIGESGHVWSASPHDHDSALAGQSGFVVYIGERTTDIPYRAEVYTFPLGQKMQDNRVDLRVGVTVTAENCGREVDATAISLRSGGAPVLQDIKLQMPTCGRVGEVAMLQGQFAAAAGVSD